MPVPSRRVFICGGDETSGPRGTERPDPLHDHPLPSGYIDASTVAGHRLRQGWGNRKCQRCGRFGWTPGRVTRDASTPKDADR